MVADTADVLLKVTSRNGPPRADQHIADPIRVLFPGSLLEVAPPSLVLGWEEAYKPRIGERSTRER